MPNLSPAKYRNKFVRVDGVHFHSKWEAEYWLALELAQQDGLIDRLRRQVRYDLVVNSQKVGRAVIDFAFMRIENNAARQFHLQDCKGYVRNGTPATALWKLKYAIIEATTGTQVEVITRPRRKDLEDNTLQTFQSRLYSYLAHVPSDRITSS
mgnify:FL=1|tara:strand:- start:893 stop:1351 length:459 start_codon:yes stop_codon:yes gene_type:complete